MKKAIISMLLTISILFLLVNPVFAISSPYDELKKKGIPTEYLDSLTDTMLYVILKQIGNNDLKNISISECFLKEDSANNTDLQPYTGISQDSMSLQILAADICPKGTTRVSKVLVTINWEWQKGRPSIRLNDPISVNWDSSIFSLESESFYSQDKVRLTGSGDYWGIIKEYTRPAESNQGSLGYYTKLTRDPNVSTDNGGGTIFILVPRFTIYSGQTHVTDINVNYTHNKNLLIPTPGFSTSGPTISTTLLHLCDKASATYNYRYSK